MSTHCTIKFVVSQRTDGMDLEPEVTVARLLQYADGYEDFVRPNLETALEEVRNMAIPEEITADTIAATYTGIVDQGLRDWQSSYTAVMGPSAMKDQASRWQWLVEVDVEQFTDSITWRIIGGSDFT